jgi:hypothetical protein
VANYLLKTSGLIGGSFAWSYAHYAQAATSVGTLNTAFGSAAAALWNDATNGIKNFCNADITMTLTETITLDAAFKYQTGEEVTQSVTGVDTHDSLPWSDAIVITTRSGLRKKGGHGRFYLPAFANDQVVSHVLIPATVTKLAAGLATYFEAINTAGATLILQNNKPWKDGTPAHTVNVLTGFEVVNKPAHQRRRVSKLQPGRTAGAIP